MLGFVLGAVAGFAGGVMAGPYVMTWWNGLSMARAVAKAEALIAKAEADAKALFEAKQLVASQPAPAPAPDPAPAPAPAPAPVADSVGAATPASA